MISITNQSEEASRSSHSVFTCLKSMRIFNSDGWRTGKGDRDKKNSK